MSIIYSYPQISAAKEDLILISDASSTPKYQTSQASVDSVKDAIDVVDSLIAGSGIGISAATGDVTISNTGVLSFTNTFGTYISGTSNAGANGVVSMNNVDLNAIDGTANQATKFLTKDNTWAVPPKYSGGANLGYVPDNGSATTFLRGDGTWVVPTNTTDITLTTTGSSGAATWDGTTLNIPQYSGGGGGGVTSLTATLPLSVTGGGTGNVTISITDPLGTDDGGTGQTVYALGDMLYRGGVSSQLAKVSMTVADAGKTLTVNGTGTVPEWIDNSYSIGADTKAGSSVPLRLDFGGGAAGDSTVDLTEGSGISITRTSSSEINIANTAAGFNLLQPYSAENSVPLTLAGNTYARVAVCPTNGILTKATVWLTQGNSNEFFVAIYDSSGGSSTVGDILGSGTATIPSAATTGPFDITFDSSITVTAGLSITVVLSNQNNANGMRLLGTELTFVDTIVGWTIGEGTDSASIPSALQNYDLTSITTWDHAFAMVLS